MVKRTSIDIAIEFIESINRRTLENLSMISLDDIKSYDKKGEVTTGKG